MKEAKEKWIEEQCKKIEGCISINISKKAFQVMKDLIKLNETKVSSIQDDTGNKGKGDQGHVEEYCSELYNLYTVQGDPEVLVGTNPGDDFPILQEEVEAEIRTGRLKELTTSSISLISHPSKVMHKVKLNRLKTQSGNIIVVEQADFREGRNTVEQIFNLCLLCERYQRHLYHDFIDFKNAFDRVWHTALWNTMRRFNMGRKLVLTTKQLYNSTSNALLVNGAIGECFWTTIVVRQGSFRSLTLFSKFLERIMLEAFAVSIGGCNITNLCFADDINGLTMGKLVGCLNKTSSKYGMEISADKTN